MTILTSRGAAPGVVSERAVLVVTAAAVFLSLLDVTVVNIAFSDLRADFADASLPTLSWVVNAYGVVFAAALVPAGRLVDRVGHRTVFASGLLLFGAASLACGLAPDPALLVGARTVQALGAAALVPSGQAALLSVVPLQRRGRALAVLGSTGAVAAATGPALGGALVGAFGWRSVFLVNVPVAAAVALAAVRVLPAPPRGVTTARPGGGVVSTLVAVGVAGVALAVVEAPEWGWTDPRTLAAGTLGLLVLASLPLLGRRRPGAGVLAPATGRLRSVRVGNAGSLAFSTGFFALLLANAMFLTALFDGDVALAGVALTPGALTAAVTARVGGVLVDRVGARPVAVAGGLLLGVGCALLALRAPGGSYAADVLPAMVLTGAGVGLSLPSFGTAAVTGVPHEELGVASALTACVRQLGGVLGIAVLLAILAQRGTGPAAFVTAWSVMAGAGVLAAAIALTLPRHPPRDPQPAVEPTPA